MCRNGIKIFVTKFNIFRAVNTILRNQECTQSVLTLNKTEGDVKEMKNLLKSSQVMRPHICLPSTVKKELVENHYDKCKEFADRKFEAEFKRGDSDWIATFPISH
ncbi:hypothetical protein AVEN_135673-1 [Araneus ventricosus]|uniref:Uncharacterized protein n=1 Tax=Araneus ventricosus TaxID=182803 RepID=A0A4Y2KZZ9_ARAVE|nr:hypothetical protein AVEN_135673-1 [Araneus ventricosus]